MLVVLIVIMMLIFLVCGMPVAFALGVSGAIGLFFVAGFDAMLGILETAPYRTVASFLMTTIPMFILMAEFSSEGKLTNKLFNTTYKWLGSLPGGVPIATIMAGAGFAAVSGSSTASAATFASAVVPEMRKYGYDDEMSAGVIAVAGTLAILIPPSIGFILYGILTEQSISKLFIAGIIPGIITTLGYCVTIYFLVRIKGIESSINVSFTLKEKIQSLVPVWPVLILVFFILGGIYSGAITATEAGAIGAVGAFFLAIISGGMGWKGTWNSLGKTAKSTAMIFTIIIGAMVFGYFVTLTQTTQHLISFIGSSSLSPGVILFLTITFFLLLGCMLDQIAILLITIPLVFPLMMSLGFDPIWFGVVCCKTATIGMVTPPIGINVFVTASVADIPLSKAFRGITPFVIIDLFVLLILCLFPSISTCLVKLM